MLFVKNRQLCGASPRAIWDHAVSPANRGIALNSARQAGTQFVYPRGMKTELTIVIVYLQYRDVLPIRRQSPILGSNHLMAIRPGVEHTTSWTSHESRISHRQRIESARCCLIPRTPPSRLRTNLRRSGRPPLIGHVTWTTWFAHAPASSAKIGLLRLHSAVVVLRRRLLERLVTRRKTPDLVENVLLVTPAWRGW